MGGAGAGAGERLLRRRAIEPACPDRQDYGRFSSFITDRNIFDPGRYSHTPGIRRFIPTRINRSAPSFTLVGTMSYEKGMFAFFDGNNSELRKVLYQSDSNSIAGFTLAEITPAGVKLQTADKKETVQLKIGDTMRQEGSSWQLAGQGGLFCRHGRRGQRPLRRRRTVPARTPAPLPVPRLEGNDVLKKLMQQREQELK